MIILIYFLFTLAQCINQIKLPLKKTLKSLSAPFKIDQLDVELSLQSIGSFSILYCKDVKSSYNFCSKFNNTFLPCDDICEKCDKNVCLGERNMHTGEYAKFVNQEIIVDGIKVVDRMQIYEESVENQTNGYFSISRESYLLNKLMWLNQLDYIISFKNCFDDMQLIIGQDISPLTEQFDMYWEENHKISLIQLLGVGLNNFYFKNELETTFLLIELNYITFYQDLADNMFKLVFGNQKVGNMVTPCVENDTRLFNISLLFNKNQSITLQPEEYYFIEGKKRCIPIAGNQIDNFLGYPAFTNRTLVMNFADSYYKIDQTLCPKRQDIVIPKDTESQRINWFSFYFIILYIFMALLMVQIIRIAIFRYKRRIQDAELNQNTYIRQQ